jgi:transposase InsO family protein
VASVVLEGRSKTAVAADYGVSRRWVHTLVARYLQGGWEAIEPRSRRPKTNPRKTSPQREEDIVELRRELVEHGHDAGAQTIAFHLQQRYGATPAVSTIWKVLKRHGLIIDRPKKRPRSSYTRFEADLPNECWQADFTHRHLANGTGVEILTFLDDHSRLVLACTAHRAVSGADVLAVFQHTMIEHGPPASTLTDNGLVFTARFRKGYNAFENELQRHAIQQKNGRPNHPQTQGKVERFQQTLKKWLRHQALAETLNDLQQQLGIFRDYYNNTRPHRSLHQRTPTQAYHARSKASPAKNVEGHWRIRQDRIDDTGVVTLRYNSRLHHIGIGRAHKGTRVTLLIHNQHIKILNPENQLLRELILDTTRNYQPQNQKREPSPKTPENNV